MIDILFGILFTVAGIFAWFTLLFSIAYNKWPVTAIIAGLMAFCAVMALTLFGVI